VGDVGLASPNLKCPEAYSGRGDILETQEIYEFIDRLDEWFEAEVERRIGLGQKVGLEELLEFRPTGLYPPRLQDILDEIAESDPRELTQRFARPYLLVWAYQALGKKRVKYENDQKRRDLISLSVPRTVLFGKSDRYSHPLL
jgi:hypothetical protein